MSAGIGGLIRLILNMENDMITKHLNMTELNPYIGIELMESMNSVISIEEIEWNNETKYGSEFIWIQWYKLTLYNWI